MVMATSSTPRLPFRTRIIGTGGWAPPRVVTNDEMKQYVDTNDEWIVQRTGIKTRHLIDFEGQLSTSDMAEHASRAALENAGLTPADIVHVNAHATSTPQGDIAEAVAIRRALGSDTDRAVVTGTKSMTGHLQGA